MGDGEWEEAQRGPGLLEIPYTLIRVVATCVYIHVKNHWLEHVGWVHFTVGMLNFNFINNLNIRIKIIKLLEENIGVNVHDLKFGNGFFSWTLEAWATEGKIDELNFKKIINTFGHQRTLWRMWKDNLQNVRKHLQIIYLISVW